MRIRRLSIFLSAVAVALTAYSFYSRPDPAVLACINGGRAAETVSACTELIENLSGNVENLPILLTKRAWAARRLGDFDAAMGDIDRALALQPDIPLLWVNRAFINAAQDKWAAADEDFERALALAPENTFTIMDRAVILTRRGDYTGALRDYTQALEIAPNSKRAMKGIIRSLGNLEQRENALEWLARAAKQWPDDAWFPSEMGVTHYVISKDYLSALAAFEAVERIDLDYVANRVLLGATHLKLGNLDIGKAYIEQHAAQLAQSMETEGSLFRRAMMVVATVTQLAGNREFFFQGVSYALIDQPELSRTAFHRYLKSGGSNAVRIMRGLLAGHFECTRPGCGGPGDEEYEAALTRYIITTGKAASLNYH